MRAQFISATLLVIGLSCAAANAQQNSRDTLHLYNQQADDPKWKNRDWHEFKNYDFDRYERGETKYFANRYYRDARFYKPITLKDGDRIFRGEKNQYYCRRSDGTTGLISAMPSAGRLGQMLPRGESALLGALRRTDKGAVLGRLIERGKLICR